MKRPSFQFYPGDWVANPNLKRCTFAERGVWVEVMCLMHDQEPYGILRWPLKDIAQAVGCRIAELQALARKGVLKGADDHLEQPFIYVPRSGRKDGDPVTLVSAQAGPIWFSSRMVKDEYVRTVRGEYAGKGGASGDHEDASKSSPKMTPKGGIGDDFGPRGSSSSSSASAKDSSEPNGSGAAVAPPTDRDLVFANGVTLLTAAGVSDRNARSFLAAQCKAHGESAVRVAIERCASESPIEPVSWLQATLKTAPQRQGRHTGFEAKNYREGVNPDGSFA